MEGGHGEKREFRQQEPQKWEGWRVDTTGVRYRVGEKSWQSGKRSPPPGVWPIWSARAGVRIVGIFTPLRGALLRTVGTGGKGGRRTCREITHVSCALKTTGWHARRYTRFLVQTEYTQLHADVFLLLRTPLLAFNYSYIEIAP